MRWRSPGRSLTIVVKMSLALGGPEVALADPQEPLSLDRPFDPPLAGDGSELYYPSDFAPRKARCDVLLVGSARAAAPAAVVQARLRVGDLDRRFVALAGAVAPSIPLRSTYLRASADPLAKAVTTAPLALGGPERPSRKGTTALGLGGVPSAPLGADFDFSVYNAAPAAQQVSLLRMGGSLKLDGLLVHAPTARLLLPCERPRVYCPRWDGARGGGGGAAAPLTEVLLRCDTLWIDVDRAIASTTWRGEIAIPDGASEPPFIVVTLAQFGLNESIRDVEARLERAPRARAVEASDIAALAQDADEAGRTALPFRLPPEVLARSALPFQPAPQASPPASTSASPAPASAARPSYSSISVSSPRASSPSFADLETPDEVVEDISDEMIINTDDSATQTTGPVRLVNPGGGVLPFRPAPPGPSKK